MEVVFLEEDEGREKKKIYRFVQMLLCEDGGGKIGKPGPTTVPIPADAERGGTKTLARKCAKKKDGWKRTLIPRSSLQRNLCVWVGGVLRRVGSDHVRKPV